MLPKYREKARALLKLCPRGIVVPLDVFLYGYLESGFTYEARRNEDFTQSEPHGAKARYSTTTIPPRC